MDLFKLELLLYIQLSVCSLRTEKGSSGQNTSCKQTDTCKASVGHYYMLWEIGFSVAIR